MNNIIAQKQISTAKIEKMFDSSEKETNIVVIVPIVTHKY